MIPLLSSVFKMGAPEPGSLAETKASTFAFDVRTVWDTAYPLRCKTAQDRRVWKAQIEAAIEGLPPPNETMLDGVYMGAAEVPDAIRRQSGVPVPVEPVRMGSKVTWTDADVDVPKGSVGLVLGFQTDSAGRSRAQVKFDAGAFALLVDDLKVVLDDSVHAANSGSSSKKEAVVTTTTTATASSNNGQLPINRVVFKDSAFGMSMGSTQDGLLLVSRVNEPALSLGVQVGWQLVHVQSANGDQRSIPLGMTAAKVGAILKSAARPLTLSFAGFPADSMPPPAPSPSSSSRQAGQGGGGGGGAPPRTPQSPQPPPRSAATFQQQQQLGYFSAAQNADNDDDNDDAAMYAAAAARFERTQAAKEASRQRVEVRIAVRRIIYQKDAQD